VLPFRQFFWAGLGPSYLSNDEGLSRWSLLLRKSYSCWSTAVGLDIENNVD